MELATKKRMLIIPGYKLYPIFSASSIDQLGMLNALGRYLDIHLLVKSENLAKDNIVDFQKEYRYVTLHFFGLGDGGTTLLPFIILFEVLHSRYKFLA